MPHRWLAIGLVLALVASSSSAQTEPEEPADVPPAPSESSDALLPDLDLYVPEGELDFRLNGLIQGSFYEGQLRYNFLEGDIEALLRYRYYGRSRIYQISVFDAIEFESIDRGADDFERIRGGLFLVEWPHTFHRRSFFLFERDRLISNKEEFEFTTDRLNTFVRVGYQLGTPDDPRSNQVVGETREFLEELLSAHRVIGPRSAGFTGAITWGFDAPGGDFDYVKAEFAALKRFRLPQGSFLISRLNGGTFPREKIIREDPELETIERFAIPRPEFFRLDGRDNLRGLRDRLRGTSMLFTTTELFVPWFTESKRRALGVDWRDFYGVAYAGYGAIGFDRDVLSDASNYIVDVGVGFEASFQLKDYTFFLAALVAQSLDRGDGPKLRLALKSYH